MLTWLQPLGLHRLSGQWPSCQAGWITEPLHCVVSAGVFFSCQMSKPRRSTHMYAQLRLSLGSSAAAGLGVSHVTQLNIMDLEWTLKKLQNWAEVKKRNNLCWYYSMWLNQRAQSFLTRIVPFPLNSPPLHNCGRVLEVCQVDTGSSELGDSGRFLASFQEKKTKKKHARHCMLYYS